jgi:hypothetical protein
LEVSGELHAAPALSPGKQPHYPVERNDITEYIDKIPIIRLLFKLHYYVINANAIHKRLPNRLYRIYDQLSEM